MMTQLRKIKAEMLAGTDDQPVDEAELAKLDPWSREKHHLNLLLGNLRTSVKEQEALRTEQKGPKTAALIRMQNDNNRALAQAAKHWKQMQQELMKPQKKMEPQEIDDRRKMTEMLGQEIADLTNKNGGGGDLDIESRGLVRTRIQQEMYMTAKEKRAARKKKRDQMGEGMEMGQFKTYEGPSEAEKQFLDLVEINREEQDEILDQISKGLESLHELALDMNTALQVQNDQIKATDDQLEKTLFDLENMNDRVQTLLEASGGMSRWCPMVVCIILILALAAYLTNVINNY